MSGELHLVKELLAELDDSKDKQLNAQYAEDLLFTELLTRLGQRRNATDILQQAQYHLTNLDQDEFVVTRGC
ncbi:hypothetical protein [Bacterioplanoides sp.]|uniref:hypothetical protein n=1 Tax=Bacterioplanoides sp. TaxID=2066072 RepID=UPI003AFF919B